MLDDYVIPTLIALKKKSLTNFASNIIIYTDNKAVVKILKAE